MGLGFGVPPVCSVNLSSVLRECLISAQEEGAKARVESIWKCSDISREDAGRVARFRDLVGVLIGHFKR